jgi:hypothetical protein
MTKFKDKLLANQERLKKIYLRGIKSIGGINIWEKISDDENEKKED